MLRPAARLCVLAVFATLAAPTARAESWFEKPAIVSNRQWVESRLTTLANSFSGQPRAQMVLSSIGTVDVSVYYATTRLLQRSIKEREEVLKAYVFDQTQKGINEIIRAMPAANSSDRPGLTPNYAIHVLRSEVGQYVKVGGGVPGAITWDAVAIKGFTKDLEGVDFPQGALVARYELSEAQWLGMQLSLFGVQNSDVTSSVRCLISSKRRIACRFDARLDKPKSGQAKEYYTKKKEELGKRIAQLNDDLDKLLEREGRETRFSSKAQLEWDITFDEGDGPFAAGRYTEGTISWSA